MAESNPQSLVCTSKCSDAPPLQRLRFICFCSICHARGDEFHSLKASCIMDFLPLPRYHLLSPVVVPYRCKKPYDAGPMLQYPERHGWDVLYSPFGISYLSQGENPQDDDLESFFQTWLYFGLLHEIFGELVDLTTFVTDDGKGGQIVTGTSLEECTLRWQSDLEALLSSKDDRGAARVSHTWIVLEHTWKISLNTKGRLKESVVDKRIWASIAALAEVIEQTLLDISLDFDRTSRWRSPNNPQLGSFLVDEMRLKCWCPFDTKRIDCNTGSVSTLYYLANLPPPRSGIAHNDCTENLCVGMSIGNSYRTKHTTEACGCEDFFDVEAVIKALNGEGIPLIQAMPESVDEGQPAFQIIDSDSNNGIEFVAISHVWAEGLGNPHSNGLPSCSLKWVSELVNQFRDTPESPLLPFWVDTICVPIEPKHMHTVAMNRLRHPYQKAKHVLVLDSYLYSQDSTQISATELWCRVLCCSWSQRLWTFQEGRLATDLWFQFADRAIQMEEICFKREEGLVGRKILSDTFVSYRGNNVFRSMKVNVADSIREEFRPEPNVRDMRESLKSRTVSVASDEALCLFCAMFFDMELVTDLAPEERMPKFWSLMKNIPIGLVFSTASEKLAAPGLHWAPMSFMGGLDTDYWYLEQMIEPRLDGFPTPAGLQIQAPGFIFDPEALLGDDSFDTLTTDVVMNVRDETGDWFFIETRGLWNQARQDDPKGGDRLALLTPRSVSHRRGIAVEDPFEFETGIQAVIGVVTNEDAEVPRLEIYRHAILSRFSKAHQDLFNSVHDVVEVFVLGACMNTGYISVDMQTGLIRPPTPEEQLRTNQTGADDSVGNFKNLSLQENEENGAGLAELHDCSAQSETERDEQGQEQEDEEEDDQKDEQETPETFILTQHRRELCQQFATEFAKHNPRAREICLAHAKVQGEPPEKLFEEFGWRARFQLQMRLRNRIRSFEQSKMWCID